MAVGFRAAGSWENGATGLTADEVVAVPAAQLTGDMMLMLASWKDYSITAQVSGWTEITEFADGTTGTGNGTGSMKVGAWYKVATSDTESDPTLDFSTTTNLLGEATILVFTKAGSTWLTPSFVTAAWPNGGSSPQTVSASSTVVVPDGSAVVGLIGIRDDSATFTRGNTALDDSAGAVTWNGNYVESPATHASTTTGNDMSCDSGYRLVTTGGTVTLRQTATLSANETGSCLWVILAEFVSDPKVAQPGAASLTASGATPTVTATDHKHPVPAAASLTATGATPVVATTNNVRAQPTAASLALTGVTPSVLAPAVSQPTAASLAFTMATPDVEAIANVTSVPDAAALALTPATPIVEAAQAYVPDAAALSLSGATPAVETPVVSLPDGASAALTGATPSVLTPTVAVPDAVELVLTPDTPAVAAAQDYVPDPAALAFTANTPIVSVSGGAIQPDAAHLVLTGATPVVRTPIAVDPDAVALLFAFSTPDVATTAHQSVQPDAAALTITGAVPFVGTSNPLIILPDAGVLSLNGFVPFVGIIPPVPPTPATVHVGISSEPLLVAGVASVAGVHVSVSGGPGTVSIGSRDPGDVGVRR